MLYNGVVYDKNSIQINDPKDRKTVVYSHPSDKIVFNFDISKLNKQIVNGDLVITTLSGGSVTVANYAVMLMQNQLPIILDIIKENYTYEDFLQTTRATTHSDNPDVVIINRIKSTPDSLVAYDTKLATGRSDLYKDSINLKLVGDIEVPEQHLVLLENTALNPFITMSLHPDSPFKYDVLVQYTYNNRTVYNEEEDFTQPIPVRRANPIFTSIYGTEIDVQTGERGKDLDAFASAGGGSLMGDENAMYMYIPEHINYKDMAQSIYYTAYNGDSIRRGVEVSINAPDTILQSVVLQNVPNNITFISTRDSVVQPAGNGIYLITPRNQSAKIVLEFVYKYAGALDGNGNPIGIESLTADITVNIEGYNVRFESLVQGQSSLGLDFRPVNGEGDVLNFSSFNIFTYSTLFDPLLVTTSELSDFVEGGRTNHTYNTLSGDDVFMSGVANEKVYLGSGNDTYIYDFGSDTVDAKRSLNDNGAPAPGFSEEGRDILRFDHIDYVNPTTGLYTFVSDISLSFENGDIIARNSARNIFAQPDNSVSTFTKFNEIYLEEDSGISVDTNNTITIVNTAGFSNFIIHSGRGIDTINLTRASLINMDGILGGYVTSVTLIANPLNIVDYDLSQNIYVSLNVNAVGSSNLSDVFEIINGSNFNDYYIASINKTYNFTFNAGEGIDTADYSRMVSNLIYNAVTFSATVANIVDILRNIEVIIGTANSDIFYANSVGSITYKGNSDDTGNDSDLVTYERYSGESNGMGIEIDYTNVTRDRYITIRKAGGIDKLYFIETIMASQANDRFILNYQDSYVLDGLGGLNTLDYTRTIGSTGLIINIEQAILSGGFATATGEIIKGTGVDTFVNISLIIASAADDVFNINGVQNVGISYDGYAGIDTISYQGIERGMHLEYNLSAGRIYKMRGQNVVAEDFISNIEVFIGTNRNDIFTAINKGWMSNAQLFFDGAGSIVDSNANITLQENQLINAGNVIHLNYDNEAPFSLIEIESRFVNFQTLRLGNFNNTVIYSDTRLNNLYAGTGRDTLDMSREIRPSVVININHNIVNVFGLRAYNFDVIMGASSGNTFNISVLAANIGFHNYTFVGSLSGRDILNYSTSDVALIFNLGALSAEDGGYVEKATGQRDIFSSVEEVVGGSNNDIFVLNPFNPRIAIDGRAGDDIVSFRNYNIGLTNNDINQDLYSNIEGFELTNNDDSWNISNIRNQTGSSIIMGASGMDRLTISNDITSLSYAVGRDGVLLSVLSPNAASHRTNHFEIFSGTARIHTNSTDRVDVSNIDNSLIASRNPTTNTFALFFMLNNGIVNYSEINTGLILEVFPLTEIYRDVNVNIKITKLITSTDYYSGVNNLVLTGQSDRVILNINALENIANLTIDVAGGEDIIDLSSNDLSVTYNLGNNTVGVTGTNQVFALNIRNWEILKTGDRNDNVVVGNSITNGFIFDASGGSRDEISFAGYARAIVVNMLGGDAKGNVSDLVENAGNSWVISLVSVESIIGTGLGDRFIGSVGGSYILDGREGEDTVDYSGISIQGQGIQLNLGAVGRVIKSVDGQRQDQISNIENIIGTAGNDTFELDSIGAMTIRSLFAGAGRDRLILNTNNAQNEGFVFNLTENILSGGGLANSISIDSFEVLTGSAFADLFTISNIDFLRLNGVIEGRAGIDALDMRIAIAGRAVGVVAYLGIGQFYEKKQNGEENRNSFIRVSEIENITFGDGDDTVVFAQNGMGNIAALNLGGGDNLLSFREVNSALNGTFTGILAGLFGGSAPNISGGFGLELTNFNDRLALSATEAARRVDGGTGHDTADYSAITARMEVDLSLLGSGAVINIARNVDTIDQLSRFESFVFGSANDFITSSANGDVTLDGGAGTNFIRYSTLGGSVIADFTKGRIYKLSGDNIYMGSDSVVNFQGFIGTAGNDVVYANLELREVNGHSGNDTLDFSRDSRLVSITYTDDHTGSAMVGMSTGVNRPSGTLIIGTGSLRNHSYRVIIGTAGADQFASSLRVDRTFVGSGGADFLDYTSLASGVRVTYTSTGSGTARSIDGTTTGVDTFSGITTIMGTDFNDEFLGLNDRDTYTFSLRAGEDKISFTGSLGGMSFNVASGSNIASNVRINYGTATMILGGTNYADTFNVEIDMLSRTGGLDGEGGNDTVEFIGRAGQGVNFAINQQQGFTYSITGIETYKLTNNNDTVNYVYKSSDAVYVDFAQGNDVFNFTTATAIGNILLNYNHTTQAGLMYVAGSTAAVGSSVITMANVERFNINLANAGTTIKEVKAVFSNIDMSTANVAQLVTVSNSGNTKVVHEYDQYRNLTSYSFRANSGVSTQIFKTNSSANVVSVLFDNAVGSDVNMNTSFNSSIAINTILTNALMSYGSNGLSYTDRGYSQILGVANSFIESSTLSGGNNIINVVSSTTLFIYGTINMAVGGGLGGAIDFSRYSGNVGNWSMDGGGTLRGSLSNAFTLTNASAITLSANNDTLDITGYSAVLGNVAIGGGGSTGEDTLKLAYSASNIINTVSSAGVRMGGGRSASGTAGSGGVLLNVRDFNILDLSSTNNRINNTAGPINIILSSDMTWKKIIMPTGTSANIGRLNTVRTVLASNLLDMNSKYYISFIPDASTPAEMNHMMQIEYAARSATSSLDLVVNNVQSILGRRGMNHEITFAPLTVEQLASITRKSSYGLVVNGGNSAQLLDFIHQYLHIDLQFWGDNTTSGPNNTFVNRDKIDFSYWNVTPNVINNEHYTMELRAIRGDDTNGTVGFLAISLGGVGTTMLIKYYGGETVILPQTVLRFNGFSEYFDNKDLTLEFPNVNDINLYAAYNNYNGNRNPNYYLFTGGSGKSFHFAARQGEPNTLARATLVNFTTFFLDRNETRVDGIVTIGSDFATEGLYRTAKGYLYFDQITGGTAASGGTIADVAVPIASTGVAGTVDVVRFFDNGVFGITAGSYYFSWGSWLQQASDNSNNPFVAYPTTTTRESNNAYNRYLNNQGTGAGIVFTEMKDANLVGRTEGFEASAFYRMQGVNFITATGGHDTFSTGKLFWNSADGRPSGPLLAATAQVDIRGSMYGRTYVRSVDAITGFDTFIDDTFTADTKGMGGAAQSGGIGRNEFWSRDRIEDYLFYTSEGNDARWLPANGHMQRYYRIENNGDFHIKVTAVINDTYGTVQRNNTDTGGAAGQYVREISRPNFRGFEKIQINDYSESLNPEDQMSGNYYKGTQDMVSVTAGVGVGYREVDLGGRYFNGNARQRQFAAHQSSSSNIRIQWLNSSDPKVDSSLIIQDGFSNGSYTSVYAYKNFDWMDLMNRQYNQELVTTYVFNTDFDFAKMNGKTFTLDNNFGNRGNGDSNVYFQQSKYNYSVSQRSTAITAIYTIREDGDTGRSFTFTIFGDTPGFRPNFVADAADNLVNRFNMTQEDIFQMQQDIAKDSKGSSDVASEQYVDGRGGISSYGGSRSRRSVVEEVDGKESESVRLPAKAYNWEEERGYEPIKDSDIKEWLELVNDINKEGEEVGATYSLDYVSNKGEDDVVEEEMVDNKILYDMLGREMEESNKEIDFTRVENIMKQGEGSDYGIDVTFGEEEEDILSNISKGEEMDSAKYMLDNEGSSSIGGSVEHLDVNKKKGINGGGEFI